MTNDAFQQIVLEKLGQLETGLNGMKSELGEVKNDVTGIKTELNEVKNDVAGIKTELSEVKNDVAGIKTELGEVKNDVAGIKIELSEVKTKLDAVCEQTAVLTEFKTDTAQHFADIKETLGFVLHKEIENERELYVLKMKQVK